MDLISREEVIKILTPEIIEPPKGKVSAINKLFEHLRDEVSELPTIKKSLEITKFIPRPEGKWIRKKYEYLDHNAICSNCGFTVYSRMQWKFCPNCGSEMEEE